MSHTPSDDEGLREDGIVRTWLREQGWLWHESHVVTPDCMDELEALISQKIIDTAKAYGGCTKCYGKGYATWRHGETYRGSTHNMRDDIKLCDCPRGKQLEAVMSQKIIEAHLDEADWFIDVRGKALANGSYPDHAVIDKHYKELQRTLTTKQDTKASNIIDHGDSVEIVIHEVKS